MTEIETLEIISVVSTASVIVYCFLLMMLNKENDALRRKVKALEDALKEHD